MNETNAPRSAHAVEETRIAGSPAVFANRVFVSPINGGAKITFAEARGASDEDRASPRVAGFLQHTDLAALRRPLDWTAGAADTSPERFGSPMH